MNAISQDIKANTTKKLDLPEQYDGKPFAPLWVEVMFRIQEDVGMQYVFGVSGGAMM